MNDDADTRTTVNDGANIRTEEWASARVTEHGPRTRARIFLRSLLIQGSWNYRTVLGTGFAFAMLPLLRKLYAEDTGALERSLARHSGHFNTHPYLSPFVLGAAATLEGEGAEPEEVERLKRAGGAALGAMGDSLVWGALLPIASALALALWFAGGGAVPTLVLFLALFNTFHLIIRTWALSAGLGAGRRFAERLGRAKLGPLTARARDAAAVGCGLLVGLLLFAGPERLADQLSIPSTGRFWHLPVLACALAVGAIAGRGAWRPSAALVTALVAAAALWGILR